MSNSDKWEDGSLGRDPGHVVRVAEEEVGLDEALGLQLISIRLQKKLINDLKAIAQYHGIGYQPMIRDLLNRFAESEIKQLLTQRLNELETERKSNSTKPVESFLKKKCA